MVKKRVGGAHRYTKAIQAAKKGPATEGPKPPQHLQRKITRKVKFIEKVQQSSSTAAAAALQIKGTVKKKRSKGRKQLPDLKSLAGELELLAQAHTQQQQQQQQGAKAAQPSVKHQKQRLRTGVAESHRLQRVLQDPGFKADPFQAITNHLMHTMPAAPAPAKQQHSTAGAAKKKKKKKGGGGGVAEMQL